MKKLIYNRTTKTFARSSTDSGRSESDHKEGWFITYDDENDDFKMRVLWDYDKAKDLFEKAKNITGSQVRAYYVPGDYMDEFVRGYKKLPLIGEGRAFMDYMREASYAGVKRVERF